MISNETNAPERDLSIGDDDGQLDTGIALCLSGGGFRAMLFHLGAILRLNELGILRQIKRVSSVSGGSITSGVLAMNWSALKFNAKNQAENLNEQLMEPIQRLADTTIDRGAVVGGIFLPGSINEMVVAQLNDRLFHNKTLQDIPDDSQGPRFIFNATNVQSGSLVRMSKPYLADYRVGIIRKPKILLAAAVAASSAFPPFLSPAEIDVNPSDFESTGKEDLQFEPYTDTLVLTDGGVYDNLGLETAVKNFKTVLVSDGGGKLKPEPAPAGDWAQHARRVLDLVDNQVRSLRKRQLVDSFQSGEKEGTYWGIRTDIKNYGLADAFDVPLEYSLELANTPTRLKKLSLEQQKKLINWGYAVCDAAIRKHISNLLPKDAVRPEYPL